MSLNLLAVAAQDYDAYNNGLEKDIFLKRANGSIFKGKVWPGVTAFPDWFHENTQSYWDNEFATFFDADTGVDIDGLWIDMNEPSNFCDFPCNNPEAQNDGVAQVSVGDLVAQFIAPHDYVAPQGVAPRVATPRVVAPRVRVRAFTPRQEGGTKKGLLGRNLLDPSYKIKNELGILSNRTANTDLIHQGGWTEYDAHNL